MAKKKPPTGGSESVRRAGRKLLWVNLTPEEHGEIQQAAGIAKKPMTVWARDLLLAGAREVVKRFKQS